MFVIASLNRVEVDDCDCFERVQLSMGNSSRCGEGDEVVCDKPELETMTMSLTNAGVWTQVFHSLVCHVAYCIFP